MAHKHELHRRNLTTGEESLGLYVFKDSINFRNIEVVRRPKTMKFGGFTPYGPINMDGKFYKDDYIGGNLFKPLDVSAAHHFLHEMAHSWQHFVGMGMLHLSRLAQKAGKEFRKAKGMPKRPVGMSKDDWSDIKFDSVYAYDIASGDDLLDFTLEQQCDIIADYFALKLKWMKAAPKQAWGYPSPTEADFEPVMAAFLADRSYPRWGKPINDRRAKYRHRER